LSNKFIHSIKLMAQLISIHIHCEPFHVRAKFRLFSRFKLTKNFKYTAKHAGNMKKNIREYKRKIACFRQEYVLTIYMLLSILLDFNQQ